MLDTLVINDVHLGVQRTGGTTISSANALREWARDQYDALLRKAPELGCRHIIVNGDLADAYDVALMEALCLYEVTHQFMLEYPEIRVTWALGNHDLSKNSANLGSVAFVGALLAMRHDWFELVSQPKLIDTGVYVIPHLANQDLFDHALSQIPDGTKWLLLHCNFDNKFACVSDHSLDLSRGQAKALKARGIKMVLGHEHQGRELLGGHVIIVGNQFPTSVSDCLAHGDAQKDGTKRAIVLRGDKHESVQTWSPEDSEGWYATVDWRELGEVQEEGRGFIRVEGDASPAEAANVIKAISNFRQKSKSFVVTNAVTVEKVEGLDDVAASIEDIRSVNVIEMLMELLDPEQRVVVKKLYEEAEQ